MLLLAFPKFCLINNKQHPIHTGSSSLSSSEVSMPPPYEDRDDVVLAPEWYCIARGSTCVHHSRDMRSCKCIVFCFRCGHFSKFKFHNLAKPCTRQLSTASQNHRDRLMRKELPIRGMTWPCEHDKCAQSIHSCNVREPLQKVYTAHSNIVRVGNALAVLQRNKVEHHSTIELPFPM